MDNIIDTQFDTSPHRSVAHTACGCGRRLELYEIYNGVILYFTEAKPCECGVKYSLHLLIQHYGIRRISRDNN